MNKTLNEYFTASCRFLATIFIITVIIVFLRLFSDFPSSIQSLLSLGGVVFIGLAGWSVVRNHGFNLKQAAFVGFLLSFGTHWSVPIFHRAGEVLYFILINSIIFSTVAVFGGWLAKKFNNLKGAIEAAKEAGS
ncbi:MAG: hypothetical protein WBE11_00410 [Candidatus Aminicenantaceae bacterium]